MAIHSVPFIINPHMNDAERKRIVDMCTQDSYISHLFERDYREPITDETKDITLVNFFD